MLAWVHCKGYYKNYVYDKNYCFNASLGTNGSTGAAASKNAASENSSYYPGSKLYQWNQYSDPSARFGDSNVGHSGYMLRHRLHNLSGTPSGYTFAMSNGTPRALNYDNCPAGATVWMGNKSDLGALTRSGYDIKKFCVNSIEYPSSLKEWNNGKGYLAKHNDVALINTPCPINFSGSGTNIKGLIEGTANPHVCMNVPCPTGQPYQHLGILGTSNIYASLYKGGAKKSFKVDDSTGTQSEASTNYRWGEPGSNTNIYGSSYDDYIYDNYYCVTNYASTPSNCYLWNANNKYGYYMDYESVTCPHVLTEYDCPNGLSYAPTLGNALTREGYTYDKVNRFGYAGESYCFDRIDETASSIYRWDRSPVNGATRAGYNNQHIVNEIVKMPGPASSLTETMNIGDKNRAGNETTNVRCPEGTKYENLGVLGSTNEYSYLAKYQAEDGSALSSFAGKNSNNGTNGKGRYNKWYCVTGYDTDKPSKCYVWNHSKRNGYLADFELMSSTSTGAINGCPALLQQGDAPQNSYHFYPLLDIYNNNAQVRKSLHSTTNNLSFDDNFGTTAIDAREAAGYSYANADDVNYSDVRPNFTNKTATGGTDATGKHYLTYITDSTRSQVYDSKVNGLGVLGLSRYYNINNATYREDYFLKDIITKTTFTAYQWNNKKGYERAYNATATNIKPVKPTDCPFGLTHYTFLGTRSDASTKNTTALERWSYPLYGGSNHFCVDSVENPTQLYIWNRQDGAIYDGTANNAAAKHNSLYGDGYYSLYGMHIKIYIPEYYKTTNMPKNAEKYNTDLKANTTVWKYDFGNASNSDNHAAPTGDYAPCLYTTTDKVYRYLGIIGWTDKYKDYYNGRVYNGSNSSNATDVDTAHNAYCVTNYDTEPSNCSQWNFANKSGFNIDYNLFTSYTSKLLTTKAITQTDGLTSEAVNPGLSGNSTCPGPVKQNQCPSGTHYVQTLSYVTGNGLSSVYDDDAMNKYAYNNGAVNEDNKRKHMNVGYCVDGTPIEYENRTTYNTDNYKKEVTKAVVMPTIVKTYNANGNNNGATAHTGYNKQHIGLYVTTYVGLDAFNANRVPEVPTPQTTDCPNYNGKPIAYKQVYSTTRGFCANYNPDNPYQDNGKSIRCYEWDPEHNGGFAADFVDMRGHYGLGKSGQNLTAAQLSDLRRRGCPLPAPVCDSAKADYTPQYCQDSGNLASGETSGGSSGGPEAKDSEWTDAEAVMGGDTSGDTDWDNDSMASNLRNDIFGDTTTDYDGGNESSSSASTSQGDTTNNNNVTPKNKAPANNNAQANNNNAPNDTSSETTATEIPYTSDNKFAANFAGRLDLKGNASCTGNVCSFTTKDGMSWKITDNFNTSKKNAIITIDINGESKGANATYKTSNKPDIFSFAVDASGKIYVDNNDPIVKQYLGKRHG